MARKTKVKNQDPNPTPAPTPDTPQQPTDPKPEIFQQDGELVVDVFETGDHFVVLAAIAGAQIKDLDISVEKDIMVIKGHRPDPHHNPSTGSGQRKFFYQECYWGPFSRKVVLPENIDTEAADAKMDKGILTIKIPKLTENPKKDVDLA